MQADLTPYKTDLEQTIATALMIMQLKGVITWAETGNTDKRFEKYLPYLHELRMPYKMEGRRACIPGVTWAVCRQCEEAVAVRIGVGRIYDPGLPMVVTASLIKDFIHCNITFGCEGKRVIVIPASPKEEETDAGA